MEESIAEKARGKIQEIGLQSQQFKELVKSFYDESARGLAVGCFAAIEEAIDDGLRAHMGHVSASDFNLLFGQYGALGSAASRILLLSSLGWISSDTRALVDHLRKIRNKIAHSSKEKQISTNETRILFKEKTHFFKIIQNIADQNKFFINENPSERNMFICLFILTYFQLTTELIFDMHAQKYKISRIAIHGEYFKEFPDRWNFLKIAIGLVLDNLDGDQKSNSQRFP